MSLLDTKTFADTKCDPELLADSIVEFLKERGFKDEDLPPRNILKLVYCTFAATVAIRLEVPLSTKMRGVVEKWDEVMMNYATARSEKAISGISPNRIVRV